MKQVMGSLALLAVCISLLTSCVRDVQIIAGDPAFTFWQQKANVPSVGRYSAVGFSIGTKGYVGGGSGSPVTPNTTTGSLKDWWEYDPATDSWSQKADMLYRIQRAAHFVIGQQGYVCTGYHVPVDSPAYYAVNAKYLFQYDQPTNTWTRKADFPGLARGGAVGVSTGTTGYVGLGEGEDFLSDWWQYNPATDKWLQRANFPGMGKAFSASFSIIGFPYVCGGGDIGPFDFKQLWVYIPRSNSWERRSDLPGSVREQAVGFNCYGKGIIATGLIYGQVEDFANDFWIYDNITDTWTKGVTFKGAARAGAVGFAINNTPYIGTGWNASNKNGMNDFWALYKF